MAQATVRWDRIQKKPVVDPDDIRVRTGNGAQVIRWDADASVDSFAIGGLVGNGEFTNQVHGPGGKWVTILDRAVNDGRWDYTVSARPAGGAGVTIDPKITNGSTA